VLNHEIEYNCPEHPETEGKVFNDCVLFEFSKHCIDGIWSENSNPTGIKGMVVYPCGCIWRLNSDESQEQIFSSMDSV